MKTRRLVEAIFSQPTAPFREGWVLRAIEDILKDNRIPYFYDSTGNLLAGATRAGLRHVRVAFMAHSDHPGFHVHKKLSTTRYEVLWYGGAPFEMMKGRNLRVYDPARPGWSARGKVRAVDLDRPRGEGYAIVLDFSKPIKLSTECFGGFDFDGVVFKGDLIYTRAADDLAGCVIALGTILDQKKQGQALAVFTRAEEIGFVGCLSLLEQKILPKNIPFVSLEASRSLPGAEIGKGPVLRLGDRTTLFNTELSNFLFQTANRLKHGLDHKGSKDGRGGQQGLNGRGGPGRTSGRERVGRFYFQRRIMDGGTCEATALNLYGFQTTGISVPLGNYHNQGRSRPAPEIISLRDLELARLLCGELANAIKKGPHSWTEAFKTAILNSYQILKPMLAESSRFDRFQDLF